MAQQYLYFYNDGSGRTALGPKPPKSINYEKIWAEEHPRTDNGDILYGMMTLARGRFNAQSGDFTPGYGLPPSPGPFESESSFYYRLSQWTRSAPVLITIPLAIVGFLALFSNAFAYALGYMFFVAIFFVPILMIWGFRHVVNERKNTRLAAEKEIRQEIMPTDEIAPIVSNHNCPSCGTMSLEYIPETESAYCTRCDVAWLIAI